MKIRESTKPILFYFPAKAVKSTISPSPLFTTAKCAVAISQAQKHCVASSKMEMAPRPQMQGSEQTIQPEHTSLGMQGEASPFGAIQQL